MAIMPFRSISPHFEATPIALWQGSLLHMHSEYVQPIYQIMGSRSHEQIIVACAEAIKKHPERIELYLTRSTWLKQVDAHLALNDLNEYIRSDSSAMEPFFNSGTLRWLLNDYEGSFSDFTQALSISQQYCLAYYSRAAVSFELGQLGLAVSDYTNVMLITHPNGLELWARLSRGRILALMGEHKKALEDFEATALEDENWSEELRTFFDIHLDIAYSFAHQKDTRQALVHLEKAMKGTGFWINSFAHESNIKGRALALKLFLPLSANGIEERRDILSTNCRIKAAAIDFRRAEQFFLGTPELNAYRDLLERSEPYFERLEVFLETMNRDLSLYNI